MSALISLHAHHHYIPENDKNSSTFLTKGVPNRDPYIVEGDIAGTCCRRIACLDLPRFHARSALDKDNRKTVISFAAYSEAGKVF
jgi:hypothetical protein